jgi:hypothetical protein
LAGVCRKIACQNLHQGGFSGAVLSADGVDGARAKTEIHIPQHLHCSEGLSEALYVQSIV